VQVQSSFVLRASNSNRISKNPAAFQVAGFFVSMGTPIPKE